MGYMEPITSGSGYENVVVEAGTLSAIANGRPVVLLGKRYVCAERGIEVDDAGAGWYGDDSDGDELFDAYKDSCLERGIDWRKGAV